MPNCLENHLTLTITSHIQLRRHNPERQKRREATLVCLRSISWFRLTFAFGEKQYCIFIKHYEGPSMLLSFFFIRSGILLSLLDKDGNPPGDVVRMLQTFRSGWPVLAVAEQVPLWNPLQAVAPVPRPIFNNGSFITSLTASPPYSKLQSDKIEADLAGSGLRYIEIAHAHAIHAS